MPGPAITRANQVFGSGRNRRREQQYPAQEFDLDAGDDAAVEAAILALEPFPERGRIIVAVGAGRQRQCYLVPFGPVVFGPHFPVWCGILQRKHANTDISAGMKPYIERGSHGRLGSSVNVACASEQRRFTISASLYGTSGGRLHTGGRE